MPREIREEVGKVIRVRTVKTGWEKFVEFVQNLAAGVVSLVVFCAIVAAIFG